MAEFKIDRIIAEKVMEWNVFCHENIDVIEVYAGDDVLYIPGDYQPTKNIENAFMVIDQFHRVEIETGRDAGQHCVTIRDDAGWLLSFHYAETVPMALCGAALKAKGIKID
ncbi:BC1872 family protein [Jeotgalibacillus haloalkalitolerans]|uniref:Phage ABA sandwich domain-containing protein n=1 Tax=Jeotgalibacillus haloalkalitolerans TaxID=3104292 RepID=A0ABU5KMV0_9BACL|nr:hypothetical protein [Jeotgalibacillus sp. HH7-29]MDZ5712271.1 hypothetical protein [Jeotgalibacillus sp. HH7-29]